MIVVVDALGFDAFRDLAGATEAGDRGDLVLACFEQGFGDMAT